MQQVNIEYERILYNLLMNNIPRIREKRVSLLLSGGLDSTIVLSIIKDFYDIHAYTVGLPGSKDVMNARAVVNYYSLDYEIDHEIIELDEDLVLLAMRDILKIFRDLTIVELSFEIPFYLGTIFSMEKNIFTGQGSDELFLGYKKYFNDPEQNKRDLATLLGRTLPRERNIAENAGKDLHTPFISGEIIDFALSIPMREKINENRNKIIVRKLGSILGLPSFVINGEKKAMQYGSGTMKILREIARKRNIKVHELKNYIKF